MPKCVDPYSDDANFLYCPSPPAAILFTVLFGLTFICHIVQAVQYRKRFCWVICMAAAWETAGFLLRIFATYHQTSTGYSLPSQLLIILAPLWINAFVYMILGRMIYYYLPDKKVWSIRAERLTVIFVCLDICSFIVQGVGGTMLSGDPSHDTELLGIHIYMAGVSVQEFFILIFIALSIQFSRQAGRTTSGRAPLSSPHHPLSPVVETDPLDRGSSYHPLLHALHACLVLISVRIVYRLVEFSSGVYSTLPMHEAPLYTLEALPMFAACAVLNVWHPGRFLRGPESEFPRKTRAQRKAEKEEKKRAKRGRKEEKERMQKE